MDLMFGSHAPEPVADQVAAAITRPTSSVDAVPPCPAPAVFERKWQTLPRFQRTRGILRLLALWVSWAYREEHQKALTRVVDDPDARGVPHTGLGVRPGGASSVIGVDLSSRAGAATTAMRWPEMPGSSARRPTRKPTFAPLLR